MGEAEVIDELHTMNNLLRGFCEKFDCGDLPCTECPLGLDVCLAIGNDNLRKKYGAYVWGSAVKDYINEIILVLIIFYLLAFR